MATEIYECPECGGYFEHDFKLASVVECPTCFSNLSINTDDKLFAVSQEFGDDDEEYEEEEGEY